jgi:hypothetical protein
MTAKNKKYLWIGVAVVGIGAIAYYFYNKNKNEETSGASGGQHWPIPPMPNYSCSVPFELRFYSNGKPYWYCAGEHEYSGR